MSREPDDEYKVGKNCPPLETRFKKGQSGNSRGRPKKARATDPSEMILKRLTEPRLMTVNGKRKRVTMLDMITESTIKRACSGDTQAARLLLSLQLKDGKKSEAMVRQKLDEERRLAQEEARATVKKKIDNLVRFHVEESLKSKNSSDKEN